MGRLRFISQLCTPIDLNILLILHAAFSSIKNHSFRFSQFQQLYKQLSAVHKQLYLHGQFPENIPIKYFNRKQPEIIEQRREWSLQRLEFIASQPILNSHPIFINFLFDTPDPGPLLGVSREVADVQPLGGLGDLDQDKPDLDQELRNKCSSPDSADLEVVISPSISIDTTPVLSPEVLNSESKLYSFSISWR